MSALHAFLVPGDEVPAEIHLKRNALFFKSLSLPHPDDRALVNMWEVREKFPNFEIAWSERNAFPRVDSYDEQFAEIDAEIDAHTKDLQRHGVIRVVKNTTDPYVDAGMNYVIWHGAIANPALVLAAAPERTSRSMPAFQVASYMRGLVLSQGGHKSRYQIEEVRPPAMIPEASEEWSYLAHLRIGRALKGVRYAYGRGLCPLALDSINASLIPNLAESEPAATSEMLASLAISLEIFDPEELKSSLQAMSWDDIRKLRAQTLPGSEALHGQLVKYGARLAKARKESIDHYVSELERLREDLQRKKEDVAEKWEKLRIAAVLKGGPAVSATTIGPAVIAPGIEWLGLSAKLAAAVLLGGAALSSELAALLPARRKVRQHPLFFLDHLQ